MKAPAVCGALLAAWPIWAVQIPAGAELSIRLTDKITGEAPLPQPPVRAVLIAPVIVDGKVGLGAGAQLTGTVKQAKAATDKDPAQLEIVFTAIQQGAAHAGLQATVNGIDNARETIDDKGVGVITGIAPGDTFSARIDQGIAKLQANDKLSGLAGLIEGAKQAFKIQDANPNIDYDAGTELTLKLTAPLNWQGTDPDPTAKLEPFPGQSELYDLVNRQPFRTIAQSPPRPSDMTNVLLLATEEQLRTAFEKAGWSIPARLDTKAKLETARALIEARGYKEGPMSILLLDGNMPDLAYQKGNNTFEKRHHLRIFRRPGAFDGKPLWVCSSTHDVGIDFSERDRTFIHRIDPTIDRERAKVVNDLLFTGMIRSVALVERPGVPRNATNATGDVIETDGSMAVLLFQ